jgi:hypothetical protein
MWHSIRSRVLLGCIAFGAATQVFAAPADDERSAAGSPTPVRRGECDRASR